jgi:hypothetical protein
MEMNSKVVLPTCSHAMCIKCYRQWWEPGTKPSHFNQFLLQCLKDGLLRHLF